jgi:futalosine hydrolase
VTPHSRPRAAAPRRPLLLVPTPLEAAALLGKSARGLGAPAEFTIAGRAVDVALVGVGLAAAGAASGRWFARGAPSAALLVGLCGTFDEQELPVGGLFEATAVACDGIGAGEAERFVELPFPPLARTLAGARPLATLRCASASCGARAVRGALLSVAAASDGSAMVSRRRRRHPDALAEDMEGYAVALAARLAQVPLAILRGASNAAGDRVHARWRVDAALAACRAALEKWVARVAP